MVVKGSEAVKGTIADFIVLLTRVALAVCLVSSVALAVYSAFSAESARGFRLPDRFRVAPSEDNGTGPTNISHVFFGIGASAKTWRLRSLYADQWWVTGRTRGYAWMDEKRLPSTGRVPSRVSGGSARLAAAARIARIVKESFLVGAPRVRWFVMGDDDTVFFPENVVAALRGLDHRQMFYVGGNSESVEQDSMHSFEMAFGGGGFAVSFPLAARLAAALDPCLDRYRYFYGSDQRIWACVAEIGATLTHHPGFHQLDIKGDPYGLLAAHPLAPLVSLHHLDYLDPIFPNQTRIDSVKTLMSAYRVDPTRILQQSFCYDKKRQWSVSVSWGYTVQLYTSLVSPAFLQMPLRTFKTWRSSSDGPFTFNIRAPSPDPCQRPLVYFLGRAKDVGESETLTSYEVFETKDDKRCTEKGYQKAMEVRRVLVHSTKMDDEYWKKAPLRQCCDMMNNGSVKNGTMQIRIRKCRPMEMITW